MVVGALESWYVGGRSTFPWFRDTYGDLSVDTFVRRDKGSARLGDYIDDLLAGKALGECGYVPQVHISCFPGYERVAAFPLCWRAVLTNRAVWIGPAEAKTMLHCDYPDNLAALPVGRKRFQLYAPGTRSRIPLGQRTYLSWNSTRDFGDPPVPDPDFDFVLQSGEMLLLPARWWHEVTTLEPSILVNQFWWSPRTLSRQALPYLFSGHPWRRAFRAVTNRLKASRRGDVQVSGGTRA